MTDPDPQLEPVVDTFDKAPLLANYADNLIIPIFKELEEQATEYLREVESFTTSPDSASLQLLQVRWFELSYIWQLAQAYNFGPALSSSSSLVENIGSWPVNTDQLSLQISSQDTSLQNFEGDTKGIYALEYLIWGDGSLTALLNFYTGPNGTWARAYLRSVARDILVQTRTVREAWENGYRDSFVNDVSKEDGSSLSLLFNSFIQSYDRLQVCKVSEPLSRGPRQVEAYYSSSSYELLYIHFDELIFLWRGTHYNPNHSDRSNGAGFREYLDALPGGAALVTSILDQVPEVQFAITEIQDAPFQHQVVTHKAGVETLNIELEKMGKFFKEDMPTLLDLAVVPSRETCN